MDASWIRLNFYDIRQSAVGTSVVLRNFAFYSFALRSDNYELRNV